MSSSFKILFDYKLDQSPLILALQAKATFHNSDPYYTINEFRFISRTEDAKEILPEICIREKVVDGERQWVHCDSEIANDLSVVLGKAIDQHFINNRN